MTPGHVVIAAGGAWRFPSRESAAAYVAEHEAWDASERDRADAKIEGRNIAPTPWPRPEIHGATLCGDVVRMLGPIPAWWYRGK